jgi:hypothetical protein
MLFFTSGPQKNLLGLGESHPENEAEFEDIVEGYLIKISTMFSNIEARYKQHNRQILTEPVRSIDGTLNNSEESINNPVLRSSHVSRSRHFLAGKTSRDKVTA